MVTDSQKSTVLLANSSENTGAETNAVIDDIASVFLSERRISKFSRPASKIINVLHDSSHHEACRLCVRVGCLSSAPYFCTVTAFTVNDYGNDWWRHLWSEFSFNFELRSSDIDLYLLLLFSTASPSSYGIWSKWLLVTDLRFCRNSLSLVWKFLSNKKNQEGEHFSGNTIIFHAVKSRFTNLNFYLAIWDAYNNFSVMPEWSMFTLST